MADKVDKFDINDEPHIANAIGAINIKDNDIQAADGENGVSRGISVLNNVYNTGAKIHTNDYGDSTEGIAGADKADSAIGNQSQGSVLPQETSNTPLGWLIKQSVEANKLYNDMQEYNNAKKEFEAIYKNRGLEGLQSYDSSKLTTQGVKAMADFRLDLADSPDGAKELLKSKMMPAVEIQKQVLPILQSLTINKNDPQALEKFNFVLNITGTPYNISKGKDGYSGDFDSDLDDERAYKLDNFSNMSQQELAKTLYKIASGNNFPIKVASTMLDNERFNAQQISDGPIDLVDIKTGIPTGKQVYRRKVKGTGRIRYLDANKVGTGTDEDLMSVDDLENLGLRVYAPEKIEQDANKSASDTEGNLPENSHPVGTESEKQTMIDTSKYDLFQIQFNGDDGSNDGVLERLGKGALNSIYDLSLSLDKLLEKMGMDQSEHTAMVRDWKKNIESSEQNWKQQQVEDHPEVYESVDEVWNIAGRLGEQVPLLAGGELGGASKAAYFGGKLIGNFARNTVADAAVSAAVNYGKSDEWQKDVARDVISGVPLRVANTVFSTAVSEMAKSVKRMVENGKLNSDNITKMVDAKSKSIAEDTGYSFKDVRGVLQENVDKMIKK